MKGPRLKQNEEEKGAAFLCVAFPLSSLLHLQGLGPQDGGGIMSRGGFTVRSAARFLFLPLPHSMYAFHPQRPKSLLTHKLWSHTEFASQCEAACLHVNWSRLRTSHLYVIHYPTAFGALSPLTFKLFTCTFQQKSCACLCVPGSLSCSKGRTKGRIEVPSNQQRDITSNPDSHSCPAL